MRRLLGNLLILAILVGAGYVLLTYFPPSGNAFNDKPSPSPKDSTKPKDTTDEDNATEDPPIEDLELYKTKAVDGKGIITPGITQEIISSAFWTDEFLEEEPIMTEDEIAEFNKEITVRVPVVYNLKDYEDELTKKELTDYIKHYKLPTIALYDYAGKAFKQSFYDSLIENTNLSAIKETNEVRYGITVKKAMIRSFPTESGAYKTSTSTALDRFQETGVEPCEPILILHESSDEKWYFAQIYNYRGWIKADSVALSDKDTVFEYTEPEKFLMVTGKSIDFEADDPDAQLPDNFKMGTKLYLEPTENDETSDYYKIKLPIRNDEGNLAFTTARISKDADVSLGYLPYTRYNIITQAYKLQGIPYDWGDKYSGRDCSSFIMYIYKTFGIKLPRNTDEQELASSNNIKFKSGESEEERLAALDKLLPGAALYMPGHVMLYLGKSDEQYFIMHAFLGYSTKDGSANKYHSVDQIAVTTIQLADSGGTPFLEDLTSAVQFEH